VPAAAVPSEPDQETERLLDECDAKLAKYRAALEAGVDLETVGEWITAVKAERAAITARATARRATAQPERRLSQEEIAEIVRALSNIRAVIQDADAADKARIYAELRLQLTYEPRKHSIRAQVGLDPDICGVIGRVRGGT
jgi:site-specific DNA recombinase